MAGCSSRPPIECPPIPPPVECDSCCEDCPTCPECDSCCAECPTCPTVECPEGTVPVEEDNVITCVDQGPSCGDLIGQCSQGGTCPEGYEPIQVTYDCNPCCQLIEEPPPTDCTKYFTLDGVGVPATGDYTQNCDGATKKFWDLCIQRQEMVWQGQRSPHATAQYCSDKVDQIDTTTNELNGLATRGSQLIADIDRFYSRLQIENEDCPGRTVVNREMYGAFQDRRAMHMADIGVIDANAQAHVCRETKAYDTMQGWCCKCFGRGPNCQQWVQ